MRVHATSIAHTATIKRRRTIDGTVRILASYARGAGDRLITYGEN